MQGEIGSQSCSQPQRLTGSLPTRCCLHTACSKPVQASNRPILAAYALASCRSALPPAYMHHSQRANKEPHTATPPLPNPPGQTAVVFCTAHRRPFTLSLGRARGMDPQQRYNEAAWGRHMRSASRKVNALAWVLRWGCRVGGGMGSTGAGVEVLGGGACRG